MAIKAGQLKERADYQAYILEMLRDYLESLSDTEHYSLEESHAIIEDMIRTYEKKWGMYK